MQTTQQLKISVPQELKVIGFDGTDFVQEYHPELSMIVQPIHDIASLLVKRINQPEQPLEQLQYILPVKLLCSQSTFNLQE